MSSLSSLAYESDFFFFFNTGTAILDFSAAAFTCLLCHCAKLAIPIQTLVPTGMLHSQSFRVHLVGPIVQNPSGFFFSLTATRWFLNP